MKQEIDPKLLTAAIVGGIVILGAVAFFALRAPSATPVAGTANGPNAGDSVAPGNQTRANRARDMAKEMREMRTRRRQE